MKIGILIWVAFISLFFIQCKEDEMDLMPFWEQTDTLVSDITGLKYHVDKYMAPVGHQFTATAVYKQMDTIHSESLGQGEFFYVFSELSAVGGKMVPKRFGFAANKVVDMGLWTELQMREQALSVLETFPVETSEQDRKFYQVAHSTNSLIVLTTEGRRYSVRVELK